MRDFSFRESWNRIDERRVLRRKVSRYLKDYVLIVLLKLGKLRAKLTQEPCLPEGSTADSRCVGFK